MNAKIIKSTSILAGNVKAPPSKSAAHRLLICAALAPGSSLISNVSYSDDILATLDLLTGLGAVCRKNADTVAVTGCDPSRSAPQVTLNSRECGSSLRFILPLCLLSDKEMTIVGSERLFSRPLDVYERICCEQGLVFRKDSGSVTVRGRLHGGNISVRGDVSSQFISGLLFALPLCAEDSILSIVPPFESRPYVDLTLCALAQFGIKIEVKDPFTYVIKGNQAYTPASLAVEGDYSNAAFFYALSHLGHDISVTGLDPNSLQGDKICTKYFEMLELGSPTLDVSDCPDLGPILMALAAAKHGATLVGTRRLSLKESDRGRAMAEELAKFGATVEVGEDQIKIRAARLCEPTRPLSSHNDHRIAMSLAVLATLTGGTIEGAEAVNKSLPEFFDIMRSLGTEVTTDEA